MSCNTAVLPPANGKKLWRVKRSVSSSTHSSTSTQSQTSVECLNNSLKIAAAGSKFSIRRPPMRRPKNKPGKPKDFVFVDLSPVKSDEEAHEQSKMLENEVIGKYTPPTDATAAAATTLTPPTPFNEQLPSPTVSIEESIFELPPLNEYEEYNNANGSQTSFASAGEASPAEELGLGIMNLDVDWNQPQPIQQQQQQPELPQVPQMSQEFISQQLYGYQQAMMQQHLQIQQLQQQLFEQQQRAIESQIISATSTPALSQQPQFQLQSPLKEPIAPQQQQQQQPTPSLPVKKSRKAAGQLQFKTYQPKHQRSASEACIKKPVRKPHHRSNSVPYTPVQQQQQQQAASQQYNAVAMQSADSSCSEVSLDDFMMLNNQISMNLNLNLNPTVNGHSSFTPVSEYSEEHDDQFGAGKPNGVSITACGFDELFLQTYSNINVKDNGEFEMGSFVI